MMLFTLGCSPAADEGGAEPAAFAGDGPAVDDPVEAAEPEDTPPVAQPGGTPPVGGPVTDPDPVEPEPDPVEPDPEPDPEPVEPEPEPTPPGDSISVASCFEDIQPTPLVDYDQYQPQMGTHCKGTNHQDIVGVERVVFVGDSITVGTPPTAAPEWYRNVLATELATRFGLEAPGWDWQNVDVFAGKAMTEFSGDFATCAKWGARTDDLLKEPHQQFVTCNPPELREKTTLIVMTAGGNDIFKWAQDLVAGASIEELWTKAEAAAQDIEDAIHWAVDDPTTFPNGVYVVFANTFEFTDLDSGNDLATCPGANLISMDWALVDPEFSAMASWFMSEYLRIAVDTGTDMVFMGEHFCGHGYMYNQPAGRCYRGPGAELWLDFTCMHPGGPGHAGIADLFLAVVDD